jgi:Glycosyltransferase family 87/Dolichyl-phosphate-mannose-protein mannosyltransferase
VRRIGEALVRLARRASDLAETRLGVGIVFVAALAVWWIQALIIPLGAGRDLATYLGAYVQLFQAHAIDLGYVLGRTPIAAVVVGALLQLGGGVLAEPAMSLLYAASIVAWFLAARTFGGKAALLTAVVLLLYPGYGILFHELSSDAVFAAAFAGWALLLVRVLRAPSVKGFAALGAGVGILTLVRPGNQTLLLFALMPLALRLAWRTRIVSAAAFFACAVVLIGGWAIHNGLRYDNYTVARGGNATVPFFRAFVTDKTVRPSNGPASRELAAAVQRDLLPKEPYRSYKISLDDFFREASPRMQVDLLTLSDRIKGWHSNYRWLRDVGVEAVRTRPGTYAEGVAQSVWGMLRQGVYRTPSAQAAQPAQSERSNVPGALPKPSEGEPIPAPHEGGVTTPDGSIYTVWTSPTEHHLVFVHPGDEARYLALHRRMDELASNLPDRNGNSTLTNRLNQASRWFPPAVLWLVLAAIAFAIRRPRSALALWAPALAGVVIVVLSALGLPAEPHYSMPVAPAFVLLAGGALFGPRRERVPAAQRSWQERLRGLSAPAATAVAALAGLWAVKAYVTLIHNAFADDRAPHDLAVFLQAAGKVLHLDSPYAFRADETYAYPPALAFLVAPLHPLGAAVATLLWTMVALGAIAASLWLLGLRDWRCYAVAFAFPFTRSAIDLGTAGPLLLLAVAVAWRWRHRLVRSGAALGAGIALKLFLWPLAAWPALTGRIRPSFAAIGFALVLILLPWAALGFKGLGGYPGLLHHLSNDEARSSYSVIALSVRAHLPETVGVVVSLLLAAALLVAAASVARAQGRKADSVALTLCIAAALAASPIVWIHYFLLLLVPLALTQPSFSIIWVVPFAYYPLGEHTWPAGDARKLGLALVTTCVLLSAAVVRGLQLRPRRSGDERANHAWRRRRALRPRKLEQSPELRTGPP